VRITGTPKPGYGVEWLLTDQLGTPRMVFDESGALANVKRHDYLPFGEELFASQGLRTATLGYSASDGLRQQFTAKERDIETGLDYFGARYYASAQGRFTGADPALITIKQLLNPQDLNRYAWQRKQFDRNYYFGKVKVIANDIWLLGGIHPNHVSGPDSGVLLRSSNSGNTWENKLPKSDGLPYDLVKSDGMLWLIGASGQIHYSKDNGDSWMKFPSPTNSDLLSIYFLDQQTGWITGDRGTVLGYKSHSNAEES